MEKRLYRSTTNKVIGGVCGGLGEYLGIDPVLVRIVVVLLILAPGIGIWAYVAAWIIIPRCPEEIAQESAPQMSGSWHRYLPGLVLVALGALLLVRQHWYWFGWRELWPAVLIIIGVALIVRGSRATGRSSTPIRPPDRASLENSNGGRL